MGIVTLAGVLLAATAGITPPGITGEVIRHNQAAAIDAGVYFYTDFEQLPDLDRHLQSWWGNADTVVASSGVSKGTIPGRGQ